MFMQEAVLALSDAVRGTRVQALEAMRDRLAAELDRSELDERSVAGLVKELRAVTAELDQLAPTVEGDSPVASIAARRAKRIAGTAAVADAGRRSQPRRRARGD
jgi:hypothetical protein